MKTLILLFILASVSYSQGLLTILAPEEEAGVVNIVTNGTFDTDSDWSKDAGWTISAGEAHSSNASGYYRLSQDIGLEAGKTYGYSIDVTAYTSGELRLYYHNGGYVLIKHGMTSVDTYSGEFTTVGTPNGSLYLRCNNGFVGSADNVVIWVIE